MCLDPKQRNRRQATNRPGFKAGLNWDNKVKQNIGACKYSLQPHLQLESLSVSPMHVPSEHEQHKSLGSHQNHMQLNLRWNSQPTYPLSLSLSATVTLSCPGQIRGTTLTVECTTTNLENPVYTCSFDGMAPFSCEWISRCKAPAGY